MFPIIPFVVGIATGVVTSRLLRGDKTQQGLEKAQDSLREATVSSLEAIESASARARAKLAGKEGKGAEPTVPANEPMPPEEEEPSGAPEAATPGSVPPGVSPSVEPGGAEQPPAYAPAAINPPLDYVKDDKDELP